MIRSNVWWLLAAISIATSPALGQHPAKSKGACYKIHQACIDAGFVSGESQDGYGYWVHCVRPLIQGVSDVPGAIKPLPKVDASVIDDCKKAAPQWGHGPVGSANKRNPKIFRPIPDIQVGIFYEPWQCLFGDKDLKTGVTQQYDMWKSLNLGSDWGGVFKFHWFDEPKLGYYCLTQRPDVIRQHAEWFKEAHIDFVIIDTTNFAYSTYKDLSSVMDNPWWGPLSNPEKGGTEPIEAFLKEWNQILGAPKVVPWVPTKNDPPEGVYLSKTAWFASTPNKPVSISKNACPKPSMQNWWDKKLHEYRELPFEYEGKPLWLAATNYNKGDNAKRCSGNSPEASDSQAIERFSNNYTVRTMWGFIPTQMGNRTERDYEWSFVENCRNPKFLQRRGLASCNQWVMSTKEQVAVTSAYQAPGGFLTDTHSATPKFAGRTFMRQMDTVYKVRPKVVTIWAWNQSGVVRFPCNPNSDKKCGDNNFYIDGRPKFMDGFTGEYNNDFEPTKHSGDFYYQLLKSEIKALKGIK